MNKNVEFGLSDIYLIGIDADGDNITESKTVSAYDSDTRIITLDSVASVLNIAYPVVINEADQNNFTFGLFIDSDHIELNEEADDSFLEVGTVTSIHEGGGSVLGEDATLKQSSSGQGYAGKGNFNKIYYFTQLNTTFDITNALFDPDLISYLNSITGEYANGSALALIDDEYNQDKNFKPKDVMVLCVKRRTADNNKYEELILARVKADGINLPTKKESFFTTGIQFTAMRKSSTNKLVASYVVEE